jgi:hypothetical protein
LYAQTVLGFWKFDAGESQHFPWRSLLRPPRTRHRKRKNWCSRCSVHRQCIARHGNRGASSQRGRRGARGRATGTGTCVYPNSVREGTSLTAVAGINRVVSEATSFRSQGCSLLGTFHPFPMPSLTSLSLPTRFAVRHAVGPTADGS